MTNFTIPARVVVERKRHVQEIEPCVGFNDADASTKHNICKTFQITMFLFRFIFGVHENTYLKREKLGMPFKWYCMKLFIHPHFVRNERNMQITAFLRILVLVELSCTQMDC